MQARVLGDLEIRHDGAAVELGGPKPRALVGLLTAAGGRAVPVELLIDQMWGESPPARVEVSLQSYVARLRKALAAVDGATGSARLRTAPAGYALDLDGTDADRFVGLVRTARDAADDRARLTTLTEALALWQGSPYGGARCPSLEAEATRLEELRTTALEEVWELRLGLGEHLEAVAELEGLTRAHPLHEPWWALLARALYAAHRQGDALAALRRAREHLSAELGVDPGPELRRVEDAVLRQDPRLDAPPRRPAGGHAPGTSPPAATDDGGVGALVGREAALATVSRVLDRAAAGHGGAVLVSGEAGVGKTRLLDAALALAAERGIAAGRGAWDDEGAPPLWGWGRAVTQLLGDTSVLEAAGVDAASATFRQAEDLVRALADRGPALLVLDDVHWADADSLRLLRRVAAELATSPVALVVGVRPEDARSPAVAEAVVALARTGAERVDLSGLTVADVRSWLAATTGLPVSPAVAERLVDRTGGNPFYVTELVRLLVAEGALGDEQSSAWDAVPAGVRDVVRHRLARLDPQVGEVARTAAVAGRTFDHGVVADAGGIAPEIVGECLDALEGQGLVTEAGPGRSRFSHALVQQAIREDLAPTARARTHAAVAMALERRVQGRVAQHSAELAEHYRLAGPGHARAGWLFAATAGEYAADRSAHDEALRLWTSAADLHRLDPEAGPEDRERLLLGSARALVGLGRPLEAWAPVEEAARSALARGEPRCAADALLTLTDGFVWGWRLPHVVDDDAIALWRTVRERVPASTPAADVARLMAAEALEAFYRPDLVEDSSRLAEVAVALVRESTPAAADRLAVARVAGSSLLRPHLLDRALALYDEIVDLARRTARPDALAAALTSRAGLRGERGLLADARSDVVRAADLAQQHRLPEIALVAGWGRGVLLQADAAWSELDALLAELEAFEGTLAVRGQTVTLAQRAVAREMQGRLSELLDDLARVAPHHPLFRELYALALVRSGEAGRAREWLGPWSEQPPVAPDYLWSVTTIVRSWVWTALGDRPAMQSLRADLVPYAERFAYGSGSVAFLGNLEHWVGVLDAALGEVAVARDHLERARSTHAQLGLGYWSRLGEEALAGLPA